MKTFDIKQETIASAIEKLSIETGMNFSFNADDKLLQKKITYTAENKTVSAILTDLLTPVKRSFKQIGTQIVIFTPHQPVAVNTKKKRHTAPATAVTKPDTLRKKVRFDTQRSVDTIRITDTLLLVDTVTRRDTIVVRDTVVKTDTVFVPKRKNKRKKTKSFPTDYFNRQESRESGWSGSVFVMPLITSFTFTGEKNPISLRSYTVGTSGTKLNKKYSFGLAIQITGFANKFNYSQTVTEGGYYQADTVDAYYTIVGNDTSWYYVLDSTYLPLNSYTSEIEKTNRIGYLDLSLESRYAFYISDKIRYHLLGGIQASFPIFKNGVYFADKTTNTWLDFDGLTFVSPLFSMKAGIGLKKRVSSNIDISSELIYTYTFGSALTQPNEKINTNNLGLRIGLMYYFK